MASKHREHKRNRKRARSAEDRIDLDEVRKRLAKPGKTMDRGGTEEGPGKSDPWGRSQPTLPPASRTAASQSRDCSPTSHVYFFGAPNSTAVGFDVRPSISATMPSRVRLI